LALTSLGARTRTNRKKTRASSPSPSVPTSPTATGSVETAPRDEAAAREPIEMPSVIVDSVSPQPMPSSSPEPRKDSTGEWFSSDSQPLDTIRGYVDDDEAPKKNHAPFIIGGVAGGLTVVAMAVIGLLPKAPQKTISTAAPPPPATPTAHAPPSPSTAVAAQVSSPPAQSAPLAAPSPTQSTLSPAQQVTQLPTAPSAQPSREAHVEEHHQIHEPQKAASSPVLADKGAEKPGRSKLAIAENKVKHDKPTGAAEPKENRASENTKSANVGGAAQAEFFIKLGRQKLNASDLIAAAANFNKAREYDARSPEAIAGLGEVAFEQGDYNGAVVHLKQALRLSPNRARYLVLLGQSYYKLGRARDAVGEYKKALHLDPANQEAQHSLELAERRLTQGS
jgi:hypothetical protein